jgi:heat-inducible transcriptional repressor
VTLKPRQKQVLRAVVEEFIASGSPVGSRHLSETRHFGVASSTIRSDLAQLEEDGLLAHPHTSAGRVPTDAGYRYFVDTLILGGGEPRSVPAPITLDRDRARDELDEALRETADVLSRVTELMAVVSTPTLSATTIRHIEVLALQPHLVMVVLITSSGRVSKRIFRFDAPVDEGLAEFARVYLNERLTGVQLGTRLIESAFASPDLRAKERAFLDVVRPAFRVVGSLDAEGLHMGGTSRLLESLSAQGVPRLNELLEMLEERYNLLELLYEALREDHIYLRIGHEMSAPWLQSCSLVAASYGVANRHLGTVSVLGPTRMDYQRVIGAVRASADSLSAYLEEIW